MCKSERMALQEDGIRAPELLLQSVQRSPGEIWAVRALRNLNDIPENYKEACALQQSELEGVWLRGNGTWEGGGQGYLAGP